MKNKISIVIPVKLNNKKIIFLNCLKNIEFPLSNIELIIAEGNNPSLQRNEAVKIATSDIIYFLDDDSYTNFDLFKKVMDIYNEYKDIAGVGGPSLPHLDENFIQKCFSNVLSSSFGGFNIKARYSSIGSIREASEEDLILCNFSIKRDIFLNSGGFNEMLYPNEENEFFNRLKEKGYKLLYSPELKVYRFSRKNFRDFAKQIFNYGRGRAEHFKIAPKYFKPIFLVPSFFVLYLFFMIFLVIEKIFIPVLFLPLILYLILLLYFSIKITIKNNSGIKGFLCVALSYLILHCSYGIGFIYGFFKKLQDKPEPIIKLKRINLENEKN